MTESRTHPRFQINWRGAVQLSSGQIIVTKVTNLSSNGIQILCPQLLVQDQTYQLMIEVQEKRDSNRRTQVVCKGSCLYCILAGDAYRVGIKISDISPQHNQLLQDWIKTPGKSG